MKKILRIAWGLSAAIIGGCLAFVGLWNLTYYVVNGPATHLGIDPSMYYLLPVAFTGIGTILLLYGLYWWRRRN